VSHSADSGVAFGQCPSRRGGSSLPLSYFYNLLSKTPFKKNNGNQCYVLRYLNVFREVRSYLNRPVFRNFFSPAAHPDLSKTHDGTEFLLTTRVYETVHGHNMYLQFSPCPTRMQAYENKTQHMLNETIDDELTCVCACACVLRIQITKDKILPFCNCNVQICSFL
jgi:hypothetical protein